MPNTTAADRRVLEATDLFQLRFLHSVALSPDGSQVAYTVMQPDRETNRNHFSLWLVPADGGEARLVVEGEPQDPAPNWSPDGTQLAFVGRSGAATQIHVFTPSGSADIRQITHGEHSATMPIWSPDGTQLLYLGKVPALPEPWYPVAYGQGQTKPKVITRTRYKFDGMGWFDHLRNQLFVVSAASGAARQVTHGITGVGHPVWTSERGVPIGRPVWSPDGMRIAFVMAPDEDEEGDGPCDVWTVDVQSGELTRVTPHDGLYGAPAWSPDGSRLAVLGTPFPRIVGYVNWLWTVAASGGPLTLVTDSDLALGSGVLADNGAPTQTQPVWANDHIYVLAAAEGAAQVWSVEANGGTPAPVTSGAHAIGSWSISSDGATLAYNASTPTNPGELFIYRIGQDASLAQQVTALNERLLAEIALGEPEEIWLSPEGESGAQVQAWVIKPPGFDAGARYPLVLQMHGGPTALYGWSWWIEFQILAGRGFVVVAPNPRGSSGYGQDFATAIYRDWCDAPTTDLLAAVDYVIDQGYVDPDQLYLTGGSYGGYLVNWIVTQTDRFRAGVSGRCVSDLRTLVLADDVGTSLVEHFGGMPWDEPELYAYGSPITHIARCKTPLLLEHQEADHRCPMDQAEQVYNALKRLGIPVEMVIYPNESHGMSRNGGPLNRVDRLTRMVDWFERYRPGAGDVVDR
jgi:dipeptidyl aminopeptidase/acylaminoacyl peptidase